jgi:DNA-binding NarL/FixJ family response regulator
MLADLSRIAGLTELERRRASGLMAEDLPGLAQLTPRERAIATRLIEGYRVTGIAEDLVLSPSTVRTHLASVFAKLGVSNQNELLTAVRSSRRHLTGGLYPSWGDKP